MASEPVREKAAKSLLAVQEFDAGKLVQEVRLGEMAFETVVEPAQQLISLFKKLPEPALEEFPRTFREKSCNMLIPHFCCFNRFLTSN